MRECERCNGSMEGRHPNAKFCLLCSWAREDERRALYAAGKRVGPDRPGCDPERAAEIVRLLANSPVGRWRPA